MKFSPKKVLSTAVLIAMLAVSTITVGISAVSVSNDDNAESTEPIASESSTEETPAQSTQETESATKPTTPSTTKKPKTTKPTTSTQTTTKKTVKPVIPKVGAVKSVKKTSSSTKKIRIEWKKAKNATAYSVYYFSPYERKSYIKLKDVKGTAISVKNLKSTTPYYFKITPFTKKGGKIYTGNSAVLKTATNTPAIKGLKVTEMTAANVSISWNKHDDIVTGYTVYRASRVSNSKYVPYKTIVGRSTTTFTDTDVQSGRVYYYRVKAYKTYKAFQKTYYSKLSGSVVANCGLGKFEFSVKTELSKAVLSWKNSASATGYNIYYCGSKNGKYKKLGTVFGTRYRTKLLKPGKRYYFRVIPYKTLNGKTIKPFSYVTHSKVITDKIFDRSVSGTYIEVSIQDQHLWFYRNNKLYIDTPVVTGNNDGVHNTPKGIHEIYQRLSPTVLVGDDYRTPVTYWMAFTYDGCGIHDSTWRSDWEYGGTTYMGNGSHGCVNTPYSKVAKIYSKSYIGLRVIVH